MILLLLLAAAAAQGPEATLDERAAQCAALARTDPAAAARIAGRWSIAGGGAHAAQCLGLAYTTQGNWRAAADAFEQAAHGAEVARDAHAATYWAQAGNAWLAAGETAKARAALDAALASGQLTGTPLGEAQIDHARALVAAGDLTTARNDLDHALANAADEPMAWLLSATLARRTGDVTRARTDMAEALKRAPDDPAVQLEAGNVAAAAGDEAGARKAWTEAVRLGPDSDAGHHAADALQQFGQPAAPATPAAGPGAPPR